MDDVPVRPKVRGVNQSVRRAGQWEMLGSQNV